MKSFFKIEVFHEIDFMLRNSENRSDRKTSAFRIRTEPMRIIPIFRLRGENLAFYAKV